jgi:hypothetical protein
MHFKNSWLRSNAYNMKKYINGLLIFIALIGNACNKSVTMPESAPMGQVNFYFASTAVVTGANSPGRTGYKVLIDSRDSTYEPVPDIYRSIYPYLFLPDKARPTYPNANSEWGKFMRLPAGGRQFFLVDTAHRILDSVRMDLSATVPAIVFLGDSLGCFRHIVADDPYTPAAGKIGLRIINLSPTTGPVFVTLNKEIPAVLPASTTFMDHTGFIPVDFTAPASVNFKVYQLGESTQFLARAVSDLMPGHAYTLLINGYADNAPAGYTDPITGRSVVINSNFSITVLKNF